MVHLIGYNGYDYNGGWPSARLFGWAAADWSRTATNKSKSSERSKEKKSSVPLRKEIKNKKSVDLYHLCGASIDCKNGGVKYNVYTALILADTPNSHVCQG